MNKCYTLLLGFLVFSGQLNGAQTLPAALTYIPVNSNQTNAIVGGTGLAIAAATFWILHLIKCDQNQNRYCTQHQTNCPQKEDASAFLELCAIAFSPLKALLSVVGIETKSIEYPSGQSYLNLAVAALAGYLAAKFAFTFTPEWKFTTAQADLKDILANRTTQELMQDQKNLLKNINTAFIEEKYPQVEARSYLLSIRKALKTAYNKLTGASSIADPKAQEYLAEMQNIAGSQIKCAETSVQKIIESPGWESRLKAAQEAADRARELLFKQQIIDCEYSKVRAMEREARAMEKLAKAGNNTVYHIPHNVHHTPVAYPPAR